MGCLILPFNRAAHGKGFCKAHGLPGENVLNGISQLVGLHCGGVLVIIINAAEIGQLPGGIKKKIWGVRWAP